MNLPVEKFDGCGDSFDQTHVLQTLQKRYSFDGFCSFEESFRYGNGKQQQVLLNEKLCHDPAVHGLKGLLQSTPTVASPSQSPLERCIKDVGPTLDRCGRIGVVEKLSHSC